MLTILMSASPIKLVGTGLEVLLAGVGSTTDVELTLAEFGIEPEAAVFVSEVGPALTMIFRLGVAPTATVPKLQVTTPALTEQAAEPLAAVVAAALNANPAGKVSETITLVAALPMPATAVLDTVAT